MCRIQVSGGMLTCASCKDVTIQGTTKTMTNPKNVKEPSYSMIKMTEMNVFLIAVNIGGFVCIITAEIFDVRIAGWLGVGLAAASIMQLVTNNTGGSEEYVW